ncbi:MAG TPA: histidine phosphatase family protein [Ramlibacter sp.]|uniref:histidine phosphatase family protein n=1 Tax=Ramlibacter sp. TaxID=1917967 RepID=UPI002D7E87A5|nr:histidine phosphatase family protein [Ramlibacter sp.]HET8747733.1 histidine phosphatase family protein [Ramlibacter sp.]
MPSSILLRCLLVLAALAPVALRADDAIWSLLRAGGQVVLLRHDRTEPGVGDPAGMKLDDCASQRNLSEEGRAHAQRLGEVLRSRGIPVAGLQASPWCRCLETARLVFGRSGEVQPALGNLFGRYEHEGPQVTALKKIVERVPERGNLFLVTHGSTIHALTGVAPAMGEMVVVTPQPTGGFRVAGRLATP